jgi:hypothetical protein
MVAKAGDDPANHQSNNDSSEYPSLIDSSNGIDYDNPHHLDSYAAFCDRLSALVEDREPMYFLYKLVNWFKSVGGTYESAQFDTQYRRTIPLEIMEDFQDVMVRNEKLSRYMTFLLRHTGGKEVLSYHGISMNENGFVDIGTLLRKDPRQQPSKFIPHLWDPDFWALLICSNQKNRFVLKKGQIL